MDEPSVDLLARALKLEGAEREAFLDRLNGEDPKAAARVRDMLAAFRGAPHGVRQDAETLAARNGGEPTTIHDATREQPGVMIGPYKILQEIGEGGFGFVYMAQQSAPIKRKVALKIVKPGMDTRQVIGRFEAERQALAMMDHPNIAKVLDAGATPAGRPYFVMELVKGVPITEYCDTASLTTEERLELFQAVCHAVLHAHQKGIIHRDIKPSNVLVTLHDGAPVPKVIDFGIAKATGQDLTDKTVFTEYRHFIGTPEYMSPEQASMSGLDVDTRSDIYSLGVLLYELLTGTMPFDSTKLRSAGYAEIQRIIKEEEPPKPSTRVGRTAGKANPSSPGAVPAAEIARHRRTDVNSLRRALSGDLDWIVMKAMEKDRQRRYATCGALAEDIRRYLANEPILARPPSAAYRLRKFTRRNRGLIAGAGVLTAALFLAMAGLGYSYLQVRHQRDMTAERETVTRAEMLLTTMNSVRRYTASNVRPALEASGRGEFVKESVPGFSARMVFEDFRKNEAYKTFVYKEASDNPTNASNKADEFEEGLLKRFREGGKDLTELSDVRERAGRREFYIARPMAVADRKCLDCHTTPDVAPPKQVEIYGSTGGYGWKLGDVVAAQVVYVPVSEAFRGNPADMKLIVGAVAAALGVAGLAVALLLRKA